MILILEAGRPSFVASSAARASGARRTLFASSWSTVITSMVIAFGSMYSAAAAAGPGAGASTTSSLSVQLQPGTNMPPGLGRIAGIPAGCTSTSRAAA